ncbi:MAG: GatB/YqeY domain-containing protein [Candidatus Omnitrophica bacterium]|nr:GatB/YqeY domain-containing protein [Candidatus Omnitrophota bacterium]
MELYQKIEADVRLALKNGEAAKLSVLRMLLSAVKMFEIEKNVKRTGEADILQIIQRQIKQHKDSIEQFEKGKRADLADKERQELKILESYMPEQMGEEELAGIVKEAIGSSGAVTKAEVGKVMKIAMEKAKGRADGKAVRDLAMKMLK